MSSFEARIALPEHNRPICEIFRATPMEGNISVCFEREPDYFIGARIQNLKQAVYLGWDKQRDLPFAVFNLGRRPVYVDGRIREIPYFCDLRIMPAYRNSTLLARGFRFLRQEVLSSGEMAQALIVADNHKALDVLTSGRGGLPFFHFNGHYHTWAISLRQKFAQSGAASSYIIRRARDADLNRMQELLHQEAPRKQFYPAYDLQQIGRHPYYQNQKVSDYWLILQDDQLLGMCGMWDLDFCKQSRIVSYSKSIQLSRRFWNWLPLLNQGFPLPPIGSLLSYFVLHTIVIRDNQAELLRQLIIAIGQEMPGYDYFLCGLDASDELNQALRGLKKRLYPARHYLISYDADNFTRNRDAVFYLEAARL